MLEFKDVSIRLGKKPLLESICFKAKKGEITTLLGKNGCGKSTLLSCIFSLMPYSGCIELEGYDIKELKSRERARKAAFLPQILPDTPLDVYSLVALGRNPYIGVAGKLCEEDREKIELSMKETEITELSERAVNTLSGGERQRAFLSMILAQDTPLIVLDEPSSFLDPSAMGELYSILRKQVKEKGRTVLTVTHDLSFAARISDNIVIIENGSIAASGKRDNILESGIIEKAFSVRKHIAEENGEKTVFFS